MENVDGYQRQTGSPGLLRADVGELVVAVVVILLRLGRLVRGTVGGTFHLLLRRRLAIAVFIHHCRRIGLRLL